MTRRPDPTTPTWRSWQLSVPATGLTHSDHFQPGSNANLPAVVSPIRTTSTLVLSGVRDSSGESKLRDWTPAMKPPFESTATLLRAAMDFRLLGPLEAA